MSGKSGRSTDRVLTKPWGYNVLYITLYRRNNKSGFEVSTEEPDGLQYVYDEFDTFKVLTPLERDDFFNPVLFKNFHAVSRFVKAVGMRRNHDAA